MRSIHQHGTTYISIPRTTPDQECGAVIYKSKSERSTENAALQAPSVADNGKDFIIERPPSPGDAYRWCGGCNQWVKRGGYGKDASSADGLDHYCRECRRQQERRWSFTRSFNKLFPNGLTKRFP